MAEAGIELREPGQHVETLQQRLSHGGVVGAPARRVQIPQQAIAGGVGRLALLLGQDPDAAKLMKRSANLYQQANAGLPRLIPSNEFVIHSILCRLRIARSRV